MTVGADNTNSTIVNAISECEKFGLERENALDLVSRLIDSTDSIRLIYKDAGVDSLQIENAVRIRENIVSAFRAQSKVN